MKKNILTLMFVLAFVFGGLLVSEVKASNGFSKTVQKRSNSIKNAEFNRKYAELKSFCKENRGPACDEAIVGMDLAADYAWELCLLNPAGCQEYQDWALEVLDAAMDVCREEEPLVVLAIHSQKSKLGQLKDLLVEKRTLK